MICVVCFFCFKQKTAYEMRISDWSSDVCSSDLELPAHASGRSSCLPSPQFWGRDSCSQQWLKIKRATVIRDPIASRSGSLAKAKNMPLGLLCSCLGHYVNDITHSDFRLAHLPFLLTGALSKQPHYGRKHCRVKV